MPHIKQCERRPRHSQKSSEYSVGSSFRLASPSYAPFTKSSKLKSVQTGATPVRFKGHHDGNLIRKPTRKIGVSLEVSMMAVEPSSGHTAHGKRGRYPDSRALPSPTGNTEARPDEAFRPDPGGPLGFCQPVWPEPRRRPDMHAIFARKVVVMPENLCQTALYSHTDRSDLRFHACLFRCGYRDIAHTFALAARCGPISLPMPPVFVRPVASIQLRLCSTYYAGRP